MCAEIETETTLISENKVTDINIGTRLLLLFRTAKNPEALGRLRRMGGTILLAASDFLPLFGFVPPMVLIANQLNIDHIGPIEIPDLSPEVPKSPIRGAAGTTNLAWTIARGIGEFATAGVYPSIATDLSVWTQLIEHDGPALQRIFDAEKKDYLSSKQQIDEAGKVFGVHIDPGIS